MATEARDMAIAKIAFMLKFQRVVEEDEMGSWSLGIGESGNSGIRNKVLG